MFRVLTCLTVEHDWRLVAVAAIVCLFASLTAVNLFNRARATTGRPRAIWIVAAAVAITVDPQDGICVVSPPDGRSGDTVYQGTGMIVSRRIVQSLRAQYRNVTLLHSGNEEHPSAECHAVHARYMILPTILYWESHHTLWPGAWDRVTVRIELTPMASGSVSRVVTYSATRPWGLDSTVRSAENLLTSQFDVATLRLFSPDSAHAP